jgi:hypothetical protein
MLTTRSRTARVVGEALARHLLQAKAWRFAPSLPGKGGSGGKPSAGMQTDPAAPIRPVATGKGDALSGA